MIKKIPAGDRVGYGLTYTAKEDEYIATLPIGYQMVLLEKIKDVKYISMVSIMKL